VKGQPSQLISVEGVPLVEMANDLGAQHLPEGEDQTIEMTNSKTADHEGRKKETDQAGEDNENAAATSKSQEQKEDETETKPPSKLKLWWTKAGLDLGTILMMFK
jgi:hypothetical protein